MDAGAATTASDAACCSAPSSAAGVAASTTAAAASLAFAVASAGFAPASSVDGGAAAYQRMLGGFLISGIYISFEYWYKKQKARIQFDTRKMSKSFSNRTPAVHTGESWAHTAADSRDFPNSQPEQTLEQTIPVANDGKTGIHQRKAGWKEYLYILGNTLCGPVLGVACYQWALSEQPGGVVLPIVATTPLVAIPFTRWLEKDSVGLQAWGGGVIAVAGVIGLVWATP